mgnify:CR=1 FL=1
MYNYLLDVTLANRNMKISDNLEQAIILACDDANRTTNSIRNGRTFKYVKRINLYTIRLSLTSETYVVATRSISSITRALFRTYKDTEELNRCSYNGSVLKATIAKESEDPKQNLTNLQPNEVVKEVIDIFFGQTTMSNKGKESARNAADNIKEIIIEYKKRKLM